ncbi:MAG: hypothetical protein L0H46_04210 [Brevibacterium sp.]|nr:hypothetical protein [Brevibacterium sp.]
MTSETFGKAATSLPSGRDDRRSTFDGLGGEHGVEESGEPCVKVDA